MIIFLSFEAPILTCYNAEMTDYQAILKKYNDMKILNFSSNIGKVSK